jgi:hypothetical protein
MNLQIICSREEDTLTLSINGKRQPYSNDKEGKQQAIIDGLNAIEPVTVDGDVYLPSNETLEVVAAVLYPGGIETEAAYRTVCRVAEKACAHLGYGEEVQLGPPQVPFTACGGYRKKQPPADAQIVFGELALAGTSSLLPRREMKRPILWNKASRATHSVPLSQLTSAQRTLLTAQVDAVAARAGWQIEDDTDLYILPLPADAAQARETLSRYLAGLKGEPLAVWTAVTQVQRGAYGRSFYDESLTPELQIVLEEVLRGHGYQTEPEEDEYRPLPVPIPPEAAESLADQLQALATVQTIYGPALLLNDVLAVVKALAGIQTVSAWQAQQLVQEGVVGRTLRQLGYRAELTWCQPYHFQPKLGACTEQGPSDDRTHQVILREIRVQNDPDKKLSLATGLAVYTPALVIDDVDDTLVYLEMVGAKQSVKANWAALVGGGKVHWIGRKRIRLDGMKEHVKIQATLPCGWTSHVLIHKQASLKEMNPEQPFYLLDDGTRPIPPLFYAMLNKCLALPLSPDWSGYLWENGRERDLVSLLDDGEGQGYAAWRVLPAPEEWQSVVECGLHSQTITF